MVGYIVYTNTRYRAICDVYYNTGVYSGGSVSFRTVCVWLMCVHNVIQHRGASHGLLDFVDMLVDMLILMSAYVIESCRLNA
jgi:hypothetical protein